jgi:predicted Zn-dependent protease
MKRLLALALTAGLAAFAGGAGPAAAQSSDQIEMQIGQQEYQALQQKGEIISSSPYYATLNPIAQQIKRVADPQYFHPFQFILVHETQPNAFAVPGGNVYVTDSLMKFVQNREELAGVLCHETSHNIHHDVLHLYQKQQKTATAYTIADILANIATGGRSARTIDTVANIGFSLQSANFSRDVESAADKKGAETCAQAGSNPWGMVWLFQQFEKADTGGTMEMLSDHPTDQHRIDDLKREFAADPAMFGRFPSSTAYATPLGQSPRATTAATTRTTAYHKVAKKPKGMFPPGSGYKF